MTDTARFNICASENKLNLSSLHVLRSRAADVELVLAKETPRRTQNFGPAKPGVRRVRVRSKNGSTSHAWSSFCFSLMGARRKTISSRDGDHTAAAQVGFILRLRSYAINAALQAKARCLLVGFDYSNVGVMDLLD